MNQYLANHKLTVRRFFQRFDRDGDGELELKEFQQAIQQFRGIHFTLKEIKVWGPLVALASSRSLAPTLWVTPTQVLIKEWDKDKSGTVDYKATFRVARALAPHHSRALTTGRACAGIRRWPQVSAREDDR